MDAEKRAQLQEKLRQREDHIRESWVRAMEARIVREELVKCQRTEGVNHYENCKEWSERYISMLEDARVKGYKKIDV